MHHDAGYHPYFPPCTRANEGQRQTILRMMGTMQRTTADDTEEFRDLVSFVRYGLLDGRAKKEHLCRLAPRRVPSGSTLLQFEGCPSRTDAN